jgi:signal transduction histidine kinase
VNHHPPAQKTSFIKALLKAPEQARALSAEKARLEAFLAAFPGEYCGWGPDRSVVYSQGFCKILELDSIRTIADIQSRLASSDAAALESFFTRLCRSNLPFSMNAKNYNGEKILKISGTHGQALSGNDRFHVLWVEDVTLAQKIDQNREKEEAIKNERLIQLQNAFDSIPSPRWLRNKDGNLIWVNYTYAEAVGDNVPEILAKQKELNVSIRTAKNQNTKTMSGREMSAKALSSRTPQIIEGHVVIAGKRILMQITEMPLPGTDMTLGITEDISAVDHIRSELKRYQSSNKDLLEHLRSAIAIFTTDERLEFFNSAFAQLWDLEEGWLNTKPRLGEIMEKLRETRRLPEQADFRRFKQSWLDMFTTLIHPHEEMLYLPDNSALRMLVIPHSMGGLMMTFEDVTSRLQLESSYNTLIAVQKETLDNLGEAVAVFGGDGRLKLWNPAYARLWGLNPEDLDGEPHISRLVEKLNKFFTPEEWPACKDDIVSNALDRTMREGRLKRLDNTLIDFTTVPLPDGGVLITYTDVTDTVRVENALREKNMALEAAERLKLDFLANVSYQLRTPLNAIMGFNEILENEYFGPLNPRQKDYTHDIHKASERLLELINDILDLSTLEAGHMALERSDVKIYDLMGNILDLVEDWGRKNNIKIHLHCPKNIGKITADEKRLKQAIINIVRNAINFTPADGQIDMTARKSKDGIEIEIKDTGIGIKEDDRARIFAPFERAQGGLSSGKTSKGAGLGLSLVKNIIALHGGSVDLQSAPGQGTTVTLFVPFISVVTPLKFPLIKPSYENAV